MHLRWLAPQDLAFAPRQLLPLLTAVERKRYTHTANDALAERFVLGRVLIRLLVSELTAVPVSLIKVEATCVDCGGPHGRPVLSGAPALSGIAVSIAHCASAVVVAASTDGAVGVDVEPVVGAAERLRAITAIAGSAFTDARAADPLLHWTRVEAALKADGRGLRVDPRRVRVHELRGVAQARIEAPGEPFGRRYRLAEPQLDPGLRVSVALGTDSRAGVTLG